MHLNKNTDMKTHVLILALVLTAWSCQSPSGKAGEEVRDGFTFAFLTDIHLQPERMAVEGFLKAIDTLNQIGPDFVLTGGDLVMDVLDQSYGRADSLYKLYQDISGKLEMPVYNAVGNHEVYGWHRQEEGLEDHPEYGKGMYEERMGERYYSFDHKGWHFMVLDGIYRGGEGRYVGRIDEDQLQWIKDDLEKTDRETPIVIAVHIPFITSLTQVREGSQAANSSGLTIANSKEVLDLFMPYKLRLVLQGHLHYYESISIYDRVHFVTAGAVSARWWNTREADPLQEGFLLVHTKGDQVSWEYVDYHWTSPEE
jgi:3',5'-cyclic AMP phosphodiesterase CpdA